VQVDAVDRARPLPELAYKLLDDDAVVPRHAEAG
jgi:hypothetical protein